MGVPALITRSDRRTLAISITNDGQVVVKAPLLMSVKIIDQFLQEKQGWIIEKLAILKNNHEQNVDITSFKMFLFIGQRYKPFMADVPAIQFKDGQALIPNKFQSGEILRQITKFYKKEAKRILLNRARMVSHSMSAIPKTIKLSNAKSRWGSCSSSGIITLNWRLILISTKLIDYVIVHELAHLFQLNHSPKFWKHLSKFFPDFKLARKQLKDNAYLLNMFR